MAAELRFSRQLVIIKVLRLDITTMIRLTRISKEPFVLNAELIRYIEARPDTFITLLSGERVVVLESMDEVVARAIDYHQRKNLLPTPKPHAA